MSTFEKIIPISDLRRRFGVIERQLPFTDHFLITKKGRPFAVLSAAPHVKRQLMKSTAGSLKGTALDNDKIWKEILRKKSRKEEVKI